MIIFAKTRWQYDSYQDFWELVELSEFPVCYIDEIDWQSDNTYIFTPLNGEMPDPLPERKCKLIWLNIERPNYNGKLKLPDRGFDEIWMCDKAWADRTGSRFFFMASDERLGYSGTHSEKPVTLAYLVPRRVEKYGEFDNEQAFGARKKELLANAKALVVLHQDVPVLSPQRFCYAAAAHLPVFYEVVPNFYPLVEYKDFIPVRYNHFEETMEQFLNINSLQDIGENLFETMCIKTNFRKEVEEMFK